MGTEVDRNNSMKPFSLALGLPVSVSYKETGEYWLNPVKRASTTIVQIGTISKKLLKILLKRITHRNEQRLSDVS